MAGEIDIAGTRNAAAQRRVRWQIHALERMMERGISRTEVLTAIMKGEVIEEYPADKPAASCLLMHGGAVPLHVVAAFDSKADACHVITAYRPDLEHFEADFRTRRRRT